MAEVEVVGPGQSLEQVAFRTTLSITGSPDRCRPAAMLAEVINQTSLFGGNFGVGLEGRDSTYQGGEYFSAFNTALRESKAALPRASELPYAKDWIRYRRFGWCGERPET
jgi:hypothetical protein